MTSTIDDELIRMERHGTIDVLTPLVPLRRDQLGDLRLLVEPHLASARSIVIDLTHVGLIDGLGLEWLLELDDAVAEMGGCVRLCGAADLCSDILRITAVGSRLQVCDNLSQCLAEMAI